ncbi:MAG: NUDIX hydrolase [Leptospira sp.]|nr:NUDIX hydrolase [Leptospira sp.]
MINPFSIKKKGLRLRVAALIQNGKSEILLIQQSKKKSPKPAYWLLPGGGVEFGETAEEALVRELNEELGLEAISMDFIALNESIDPQGMRHLVQLIFLVKVKDGIPILDSREKAITGFGYFTPKEILSMDLRPDTKDFFKKKKFVSADYIKSKWVEE